ncbi:hypothetical protein AFK69_09960 [Xenorhabdus sp. GDc328]|nr:hypothetical protein AAY47_16475 [Xenorhabdus griffiniae]KOP33448.1 hypothetical protein AFK69_09960 [Xenorhabdus sp. GDc328]
MGYLSYRGLVADFLWMRFQDHSSYIFKLKLFVLVGRKITHQVFRDDLHILIDPRQLRGRQVLWCAAKLCSWNRLFVNFLSRSRVNYMNLLKFHLVWSCKRIINY